MTIVNRFIKDLRHYYAYFIRAGKAELKSEVAFSHLGWLWWILDPLLFMLVYTFVNVIVFGKSEQYLAAFIFIGYNTYEFFQNTIKQSVSLIKSNKAIVKNVYIPKPMLVFTKLYVNLFKYAISFFLVFVTMVIYKVPVTWRVVYFIPLVFLMILISVGFGMILMNFGVYVDDLSNVTGIVLRLLFYLSGVFYDLGKRIDEGGLQILLLKCNPIAFVMDQMRKCLLYSEDFSYKVYIVWMIAGFGILYLGIRMVYKNENGYVKVI